MTDVQFATTPTVGSPRVPQAAVSGLTLVALSAFALWATADLPQGTLRSMGPAMLPRTLAIAVGACGVALIAFAYLRREVAAVLEPGDAVEGGWSLRGVGLVVLAIALFAATLRPTSFGSLTTPDFGLVLAGPLAIVVGGYASPEARLRELLVLGLALTAFCMVLFGDLLNLPMPLYPQSYSDLFPATVSNDNRLRLTAAVMAIAAVIIHYTGRRRRGPEPIDVAPPTGRIA